MKLTNDKGQALTIGKDIVTIRDNGKTYKFPFSRYSVQEATSSDHYTYIRFEVEKKSAYVGHSLRVQYLSVGFNEMCNSVVFTAVYIRELKRGNKAVQINGSFKCNVREWEHRVQLGEC